MIDDIIDRFIEYAERIYNIGGGISYSELVDIQHTIEAHIGSRIDINWLENINNSICDNIRHRNYHSSIHRTYGEHGYYNFYDTNTNTYSGRYDGGRYDGGRYDGGRYDKKNIPPLEYNINRCLESPYSLLYVLNNNKNNSSNIFDIINDPRIDPMMYDNKIIKWSIGNGQLELFKHILSIESVKNNIDINMVLIYLCSSNTSDAIIVYDMIKYLIDNYEVNLSINNNCLIKWSVDNNNIELFKYLINIDSVKNNVELYDLLSNACNMCSYEIVEYLISECGVNVLHNNNKLIKKAVRHRDTKLCKILISSPKFGLTVNLGDIMYLSIIYDANDIFDIFIKNKKYIFNQYDLIELAYNQNNKHALNLLLHNKSALDNMRELTRNMLISNKILPTYSPRKVIY